MTEIVCPTGPALVTGASGFIGRHLVQALLRENRQVLAFCRHPGDIRDLKHPLLQVISGDLENPDCYLPHLNGEVTVFHLAAVRCFPGTSLERMHHVNVVACLELGRASAQACVAKFVYVSTATIFGPFHGRSATEADGYCRQMMEHNYIRSKAQALGQMKRLMERGLPLVTVYPTIVFGPDHPTHPNRVTGHLRRLLRSGVDLVVGGGHQRRNLVYVDDVVRGILLAERFGSVGEEFILGGDDISHREFNRMALSLAGRKPRLSLSIPVEVSLAAAKVADRLRGYDRGSGYEAALKLLTKEWRYSALKAKQILCYTWTPVRDAILQTLQFIESGA